MAPFLAAPNIQIASIGLGNRGTSDALTACKVTGVRMVAVADLYSGRRQRAREVFGDDRFVTADYHEFLARKDVELIGLILSLHRRYALALDELTIAVEQNPGSAQVRFYCGRLYYRNAIYGPAVDELLACLKLQPTYPEALENLGLAYEV